MCNKKLFLITLMFLSGCSSMNSKFDCPMGSGVMCKSISEVNAMVDGGQVGRSHNNNEKSKNPPSHVMRAWIAPYHDGDGNYHDQSLIYYRKK